MIINFLLLNKILMVKLFSHLAKLPIFLSHSVEFPNNKKKGIIDFVKSFVLHEETPIGFAPEFEKLLRNEFPKEALRDEFVFI